MSAGDQSATRDKARFPLIVRRAIGTATMNRQDALTCQPVTQLQREDKAVLIDGAFIVMALWQ